MSQYAILWVALRCLFSSSSDPYDTRYLHRGFTAAHVEASLSYSPSHSLLLLRAAFSRASEHTGQAYSRSDATAKASSGVSQKMPWRASGVEGWGARA